MTLRDDLLTAARYLIEDGCSISEDDAVRIGLRLAEMAGICGRLELEELAGVVPSRTPDAG